MIGGQPAPILASDWSTAAAPHRGPRVRRVRGPEVRPHPQHVPGRLPGRHVSDVRRVTMESVVQHRPPSLTCRLPGRHRPLLLPRQQEVQVLPQLRERHLRRLRYREGFQCPQAQYGQYLDSDLIILHRYMNFIKNTNTYIFV